MKVIKPQTLGVLTRCLEFKGRFRLGVSVLMHVPLGAAPDLFSEVSLWKLAAEVLGPDAAVDGGIPKLVPEFLVVGRAYPAGARPAPGCEVRARFAGVEKALHVIGDRHWLSADQASDPLPFDEMALDWSRAFGGEGFAANPLGKGMVAVDLAGEQRRPLPNIEYADRHIERSQSLGTPAGFGVVDQTWPERAQRAGTHDADWLKTDYPGFARDIDWRFFNLAPADQWLKFPVAADAPFRFENLHPSRPVFEGKLPGFASRCFVNRRAATPHEFEELPMQLGTVWFFPHLERAFLVYQGFCDIAEEDAADIRHLAIAAEHAGQPRPAQFYLDAFARRLDKENGLLHALSDSELIPEGLSGKVPDQEADRAMFEGEGLLQGNVRRQQMQAVLAARAEIASHGLDPDEHGPPIPGEPEPPPDLEHLPQAIEALLARSQAERERAEASMKATLDGTEQEYLAQQLDFSAIRAEIAHQPAGPPQATAQQQHDELHTLAQGFEAGHAARLDIEAVYQAPGWRERQVASDQDRRKLYRLSAHVQGAAPRLDSAASKALRETIQTALHAGQSLAQMDFTGADLSGMDLSGGDFSGSFFEGADFSDARLVGCKLPGAVLTRARLHRTDLTDADLTEANLGHLDADGAIFDRAVLKDAILNEARLAKCRLRAANLQGAHLLKVQFEQVDGREANGESLICLELDLRGLDLQGANLTGAAFLKCDLRGVNFSGSQLGGAVLLAAQANGARFVGAKADNLRCVELCDLSAADFTDASLRGANLRGTQLTGAQFGRADLGNADLSEADLRRTWFYMAKAVDSRWVKADLREAILVSCNLMNACMQRSNLLGADLRHANLYAADLARVRVDRSSLFQHALLTRARTLPRAARPAAAKGSA